MRRLTHPAVIVTTLLAISVSALITVTLTSTISGHERSVIALDGLIQFASLVLAFSAGVFADRMAERREQHRQQVRAAADDAALLTMSLTAVRAEIADCCLRAEGLFDMLDDDTVELIVFFESAWEVARAPIARLVTDQQLLRNLSTFYRRVEELQWALRETVRKSLAGTDITDRARALVLTRIARVLQERESLFLMIDVQLSHDAAASGLAP